MTTAENFDGTVCALDSDKFGGGLSALWLIELQLKPFTERIMEDKCAFQNAS